VTRSHLAAWLLAFLVVVQGASCGGDNGGENGPDTTPPGILSTQPEEGATGVPPDVKIHVVFDEAIERASINSDVFHLELGGQPRYGNVSYDLDRHRATLSMMGELDAGAAYQAVLEPGVRDLAGNRMNQAYRWSFTVAP
jgi:hypothetical protein